MAKLKVFCVYDSKVQAFMQPFFLRSNGEAIRSFADIANDPQSNVCRHPEDFSLMLLGEYDDETGSFTNEKAPTNLGLASSYKKPPESQAPLFDRIGNQTVPVKPGAHQSEFRSQSN